MAIYNFKCSSCSNIKSFSVPITEYAELNLKNASIGLYCDGCGKASRLTRVFDVSSSKIERDKEEMMRQIKEETRKIVQSVRDGNTNAIRNIYGEE